MQRRQFLTYSTASVCLGPAACGLSGCGTLLHNDRIGQPHTNQIDWKIAALDGLGMLLFFVPGVVAFVVDFYTGAIYIPYDEYVPPSQVPYQQPGPAAQPYPNWAEPEPALPAPPTLQPAAGSSAYQTEPSLQRIAIPRDQLTPHTVQQVVSQQVGQPVSLESQQTRLSPLPELASFESQRQCHESDKTFGFGIRQFFERIQNS